MWKFELNSHFNLSIACALLKEVTSRNLEVKPFQPKSHWQGSYSIVQATVFCFNFQHLLSWDFSFVALLIFYFGGSQQWWAVRCGLSSPFSMETWTLYLESSLWLPWFASWSLFIHKCCMVSCPTHVFNALSLVTFPTFLCADLVLFLNDHHFVFKYLFFEK